VTGAVLGPFFGIYSYAPRYQTSLRGSVDRPMPAEGGGLSVACFGDGSKTSTPLACLQVDRLCCAQRQQWPIG
jgi:hypothetical protein